MYESLPHDVLSDRIEFLNETSYTNVVFDHTSCPSIYISPERSRAPSKPEYGKTLHFGFALDRRSYLHCTSGRYGFGVKAMDCPEGDRGRRPGVTSSRECNVLVSIGFATNKSRWKHTINSVFCRIWHNLVWAVQRR